MNASVSVIVPVYNTKRYLKRCLDSILNQTYENIEIIVVDDGSADGSDIMCDEYAEKYAKIRVIHKKNGGLSDSRNVALDTVKTDYVAFVDSDDYIDPKMIEVLVANAEKTQSDISVCGMKNVETEDTEFLEENPSDIVFKDSYEAFKSFVKDTKRIYEGKIDWENIPLKSNSCDKLFKTSVFKDIRYPVGKLCEDLLLIGKLIDKSQKIVIDTYKGYYYYQRSGSIMHSDSYYMSTDDFEAYEDMKKYLIEKYNDKELYNILSLIICRVAFEKYKYLYKKDRNISRKTLRIIMRKNIISMFKNSDVSINEKLVYVLAAFFPFSINKKI